MDQRGGQDGYCRKGSDDYADSLENENGHEKKNIRMVIMLMALIFFFFCGTDCRSVLMSEFTRRVSNARA